MAEILEFLSEKAMGETTAYRFGFNHNVLSVEVTLEGDIAACAGQEVLIRYALNGVTSDLIYFASVAIGDSPVVKASLFPPVLASHIYVTLPDEGLKVQKITAMGTHNPVATDYYPAYFDTDLKENHFLDSVHVFTSREGFSHYSVYTSLDGRDFTLLGTKDTDEPCNFETGDVWQADGREARIIRVLLEYNSASASAVFDRVSFTGRPSGSQVRICPEPEIPDFETSKWNVTVTPEDGIEEVYGIIRRRLGAAYTEWFALSLADHPEGKEYDYFCLSDDAGKIRIRGNNGVSLAMGLNHYLKYFCKVNISQVGDQAKMPAQVVPVEEPVFRETQAAVRYAYNYCTLSYSMAFWGEKEWQEELDWLALNGVNVVLDATAQEEVWRRFLRGLNYTHDEVKRYVAGPAYYAWAYMANLSGFGGPVHDSWFAERTELARTNQLKMRKLGMYPVLQGYSGMVPNDIRDHYPQAQVIPQGTWCSFARPAMLRTDSESFRDLADRFYQAQKEVYGSYSKFFATDPFHEGGNRADLAADVVSREVLKAMLKNQEEAVWVIQSWQENPSSDLLKGLADVPNGRKHALILDLYAEKMPNHMDGRPGNPYHGYSVEFDGTPWVYCMLNNFGGRLGLHGHMDNLATKIPEAFNGCEHIVGIGITPEASMNNPVLYDFLFESVWREDASESMTVIDLNAWVRDYAQRRYGAVSPSAEQAWDILLRTVYKAELNNVGQGAPETIMNARPGLNVKAVSTWGNGEICYEKKDLVEAARLLLVDYEKMQESEGYAYDLITVLQQVLSNFARDAYEKMVSAFREGNGELFACRAEDVLEIGRMMDDTTGCSEYYLLGRWVEQARHLARNADDFSKKLYEMNAKSLVTTWGSFMQCETGGLHDYSNRQWSGLIRDFYIPRWERWIEERKKELAGEAFEEKIDWFAWEWKWVRSRRSYNAEPIRQDLKELGNRILNMLA